LGVHYVSDVWGGYLIGALWLIIGIAFSEYQLAKRKKNSHELNKQKMRCISLLFIAIAGTIYITSGLYYNPEALPDLQPEKVVKIANLEAIFTDYHFKYTETLFAKKQEPLSFIIIAKNDEKLMQIFKKAGWQLADPVNASTIWKLAKAAIRENSYPNAPMTPSFWKTKIHDFGFEKETENSNVRERHHARFWKTSYTTKKEDAIYVGTASFDDNIKWGITHSISPDIDTERDFLLNELLNTNLTKKIEEKAFVKPVLGKNFAGDEFFTDGNLYVIKLR
jgi:undecaprenyl-diphosphatase